MNIETELSAWVLTDERAGNRTQAVGLADELGAEYDVKELRFGIVSRLHNILIGASLRGLKRADRRSLAHPWPHLVIAAGRRTAPIARWIKAQSGRRTQIVQLGRKGGQDPRHFDAVVTPGHVGLPVHPKRIVTLGPLNRVSQQALIEAAAAACPFEGAPKPWVALMVGGATSRQEFGSREAADLGAQVALAVQVLGGSLVAITSPRTGPEATTALEQAIANHGNVLSWRPDDPANPYLPCLAHADIVIVTGDSESMIAEASATGKATYIYPLTLKPPTTWLRLGSWVTDLAARGPAGEGGLCRRLCRVLIERGIVRPPRNLTQFHAALERGNYAKIFCGSLSLNPPGGRLKETERVAKTLRTMLKFVGI